MFQKKIERLLAEMEKYSESHDTAWSIPRDEARFLHLMALLAKPKAMLEVGTSTGYSTIWLGLAAKKFGGKIVTIEYDPEKVRIARGNFKKAGMGKTITILEGDANEILPKLRGKVDFAFLDGVKEEYLRHFKWILPCLRRGGIVAADNAGDFAGQMGDYLAFARGNKKLVSTFIPIGNG
ncbi:MAG: class I SAM-dependent methyltransferase, partial [Candidatus Micrarchaeota archaeon]